MVTIVFAVRRWAGYQANEGFRAYAAIVGYGVVYSYIIIPENQGSSLSSISPHETGTSSIMVMGSEGLD